MAQDPSGGIVVYLGDIPMRPYEEGDPFWTTEVEGNHKRIKWSLSPENFKLALDRGLIAAAS